MFQCVKQLKLDGVKKQWWNSKHLRPFKRYSLNPWTDCRFCIMDVQCGQVIFPFNADFDMKPPEQTYTAQFVRNEH